MLTFCWQNSPSKFSPLLLSRQPKKNCGILPTKTLTKTGIWQHFVGKIPDYREYLVKIEIEGPSVTPELNGTRRNPPNRRAQNKLVSRLKTMSRGPRPLSFAGFESSMTMDISCYSFAMRREESGLHVRERWLLVPRESWIGWGSNSIDRSMPLSAPAARQDEVAGAPHDLEDEQW
jgi:hypothetical protein